MLVGREDIKNLNIFFIRLLFFFIACLTNAPSSR